MLLVLWLGLGRYIALYPDMGMKQLFDIVLLPHHFYRRQDLPMLLRVVMLTQMLAGARIDVAALYASIFDAHYFIGSLQSSQR